MSLASPQRRDQELVLVQLTHSDCRSYEPVAHDCDQLRAEQLPWIPTDAASVTAEQAQQIQTRLGTRIQELIRARVNICHTDYPRMVHRHKSPRGLTMLVCCDLRGIYVEWDGDWGAPGPNLLDEEPQGFADQLALIRRRGFVDCLVIDFVFTATESPSPTSQERLQGQQEGPDADLDSMAYSPTSPRLPRLT